MINKKAFLIIICVSCILSCTYKVIALDIINNTEDFDILKYGMVDENTNIEVNDDVIVGKDNWLFYNVKTYEDVQSDFNGTNLFTKEQLEYYTKELINIKDDLKNKGIDLVFFFAPNKNRIYPEYYPIEMGTMSDKYRLKQFIDYVATKSQIPMIYTYEHLIDSKNKLPGKYLYHKYDTHWNNLGGYVGAYDFLKYFDVTIPYTDDPNLRIDETEGMNYELFHVGDVENIQRGDIEYCVTYLNEPEPKFISLNDGMAQFNADNPKLKQNIFVMYDSYFANMMNHIGCLTSNMTICMYTAFDRMMLYNFRPNVLVVELLERQ